MTNISAINLHQGEISAPPQATPQPSSVNTVKPPFVLNPPALADDTPSRHPCKIRVPSAQKRFTFDPYKAQVTLGLESNENQFSDEDDASDDSVDDSCFDNVMTTHTTSNHHHVDALAPPPVDSNGNTSTESSHAALPHLEPSRNHLTRDQQSSSQCGLSSMPSSSPSLVFQQRHHSDGHCQQMAADSGAHFTSVDGCYRMNAGNVHHALVRFKFSEDVYVVPLCDRRGLTVGDLVVVEGDRGENIGEVVADRSDQFDESDYTTHKPILRRALNKDRKRFYHARRKDAVASKAAQQLSQELKLKMHVLDAEFQSDLMKLTIYFRSFTLPGEQIDFRELQRGLFKQFRCRIWLVNWDGDTQLQKIVQRDLHVGSPQTDFSSAPPPESIHNTAANPTTIINTGVPSTFAAATHPNATTHATTTTTPVSFATATTTAAPPVASLSTSTSRQGSVDPIPQQAPMLPAPVQQGLWSVAPLCGDSQPYQPLHPFHHQQQLQQPVMQSNFGFNHHVAPVIRNHRPTSESKMRHQHQMSQPQQPVPIQATASNPFTYIPAMFSFPRGGHHIARDQVPIPASRMELH